MTYKATVASSPTAADSPSSAAVPGAFHADGLWLCRRERDVISSGLFHSYRALISIPCCTEQRERSFPLNGEKQYHDDSFNHHEPYQCHRQRYSHKCRRAWCYGSWYRIPSFQSYSMSFHDLQNHTAERGNPY